MKYIKKRRNISFVLNASCSLKLIVNTVLNCCQLTAPTDSQVGSRRQSLGAVRSSVGLIQSALWRHCLQHDGAICWLLKAASVAQSSCWLQAARKSAATYRVAVRLCTVRTAAVSTCSQQRWQQQHSPFSLPTFLKTNFISLFEAAWRHYKPGNGERDVWGCISRGEQSGWLWLILHWHSFRCF